MIKLLVDRTHGLCPVFECDSCARPIVDITASAVLWDPVDLTKLYFVHHAVCWAQFELMKGRMDWRRLSDFLGQLVLNAESPIPA